MGLPLEDIKAAVEQIIENDVFDQVDKGSLESVNRMELSIIERKVII